jgi:hypothetical protein
MTGATRGSALGLVRRCELALHSAITKGPRLARVSWQHFADYNSTPWESLQGKAGRAQLDYSISQLEYALHQKFPRTQIETVLEGVAEDPQAQDVVLKASLQVLSVIPGLKTARELVLKFIDHPRLIAKGNVWLAVRAFANPNIAIPSDELTDLIMMVIQREMRPDVGENDVPYSARMAQVVEDLQLERKLTPEQLIALFTKMAVNPLVSYQGLTWITGGFAGWVENIYLLGRRLPPRSLTQPLIETFFRRYQEILGPQRDLGSRRTPLRYIQDAALLLNVPVPQTH